ncbi:hypothetical protein, partial [Stenoxybacter acetivorans]|uniref:hypothetical protein n=1 Tax=Stenoxybacter acetivorans TaxID=422441 RepID=UPI001B7FFB9E
MNLKFFPFVLLILLSNHFTHSTLLAGRDLNLQTVQTGDSLTLYAAADNYSSHRREQDIGSQLQTHAD